MSRDFDDSSNAAETEAQELMRRVEAEPEATPLVPEPVRRPSRLTLRLQPDRSRPPITWAVRLGNALMVAGFLGAAAVLWQSQRPVTNDGVRAASVPLAGRAVLGDPSAPVLAIFVDPMCPHCRALHAASDVKLRQAATEGHLRLTWVQFAFLGPESTRLAISLKCLERLQPTVFFARQSELAAQSPADSAEAGRAFFVRDVRDPAAFDRCVEDDGPDGGAALVAADVALAKSLGVQGTPYLHWKGAPLQGRLSELLAGFGV